MKGNKSPCPSVPPTPTSPSTLHTCKRKERGVSGNGLACRCCCWGGWVAVRGSSFLMGIFHLLYTFLSPVPYSQLSISFMINRYARKLLTLSLGIMLITKSNLCKKKKASGWERVGQGCAGGGRRSWRRPSPGRRCPAKPAVGRNRRLQMDTSRSGLQIRTLTCTAAGSVLQAGVSPESQLLADSAAIQTQTSSSLQHAMVIFVGLFCGRSAGHVGS